MQGWQDVHARVRRLRVARANLEIAHIDGIAESGKINNRPENLLTICDGHHTAQHDGRLRISGRAPRALVIERIEHPAPSSVKAAARDALVRMGYGPRQSAEVVGRVVGSMDFAHVGKAHEVVTAIITAARAALGGQP